MANIIDKVKSIFVPSKKFDTEFARRFADKCRHSKEFLDFLTASTNGDISKLQSLAIIEDSLKTGPCKHDRDLPFDEKKWTDLVKNFFAKCMPQKAEEAKQILDKTHPYFIDENGNSHVQFIQVPKGDRRSSSVGQNGSNMYLNFDIYIHGSLDDLRTTAHETSHALSSHHQHLIQLIRSGVSKKEIEDYTRFKADAQSVGEIESHIVEALFNQYLLSNNIYTQEDMQNYEQGARNSLQHDINVVRQESDIIRDLNGDMSEKSLNKLYTNYMRTGKKQLASRIEKIVSESNSSHMFRYVVGRVVADRWIDKFNNSTKTEKEQMLTAFQNYLDHTHEMTVDKACQTLLGANFVSLAQDYAKSQQNQIQTENIASKN